MHISTATSQQQALIVYAYQNESQNFERTENGKQKNPLSGGFIYFWQDIKLALNIAYFVAFCKPN
ncbi:TPA: hypothetical protein RLU14_001438 [Enterobacter cloacae]|nr:hypothetical protein [Enterobacter cloacae]